MTDKIPILSDTDQKTIRDEPETAEHKNNSDVIKVVLDVNCCPCPKEDYNCDKSKCDDCKYNDCKSEDKCGCSSNKEYESNNVSFCQRWFPMFSRISEK
jgi:hypothetical protein